MHKFTVLSLQCHNGGRAGPVDREDGLANTSLSNNFSEFSLGALGMQPTGRFVWV